MSNLLAALTSLVSQLLEPLLLYLFRVFKLFFLIIGYLMLTEFATWLLLAPFATAPPHFSAPFRLVHSATPIKVFLFIVLFRTLLALLQHSFKLAFSR